mgnify:CR=1 FL=1
MSKLKNRVHLRLSDSDVRHIDRICDEIREATGNQNLSRSELMRSFLFVGAESQTREEPSAGYDKGRSFEREILEQIDVALWDADVEHLDPKSGERRPDIRGPFFDLECKRGRRPSTRQALQQAREAAARGQIPVAVIKDDDSDAFVALDWTAFLALWRLAYEIKTYANDLAERLGNVDDD